MTQSIQSIFPSETKDINSIFDSLKNHFTDERLLVIETFQSQDNIEPHSIVFKSLDQTFVKKGMDFLESLLNNETN